MGPFSLILKHSAKFDTTTELPAQWFVGAFLGPWTGHALFQLKQQLCSRLNCRRCSAIVVLGTTDNLSWLICFLRNCKVLFLMIKCTSLVKNSNTWFSRGGAACLSGTFLYTSPLLMFLAWCHLQGEQFTHHLKEPIGLDHDFTSKASASRILRMHFSSSYCWKTSPKKSHFRNVLEKYRGMFVI